MKQIARDRVDPGTVAFLRTIQRTMIADYDMGVPTTSRVPDCKLSYKRSPFFLGRTGKVWLKLGIIITSARVEVFCDDPDTFIAGALEAGAKATRMRDRGIAKEVILLR